MDSPETINCPGCGQRVGYAKPVQWQNPVSCSLRCWVTEESTNPNFQRDDLIATLARDGVPVSELAAAFDLARQRIYQILKKAEQS